jgi:hypothetical protein
MKAKGIVYLIMIKHIVMKWRLFAVCILLILSASSEVSAQKLIADTTGLTIGQQINLNLEITIEKDEKVQWPALLDTLSKSVEIVRRTAVDSAVDAVTGARTYRQTLVITSFDTGFHVVPPVAFRIFSPGVTEITTKETAPFLLSVSGVAVDMEAEIRDLKPVLEAPYMLRDFLPWILLLLAIALLAVLGWFFYQSRKKKKPLIKLTLRQPKPAHLVALEQLELLKSEQLWQKGQIKEYYSRLTDILRGYFDLRFNVNAAEMTSDEIISSMKDELSNAQRLNDLKKILGLADMAKFAKARPLGADNELSHTLAVAIVNSTKPAPELNPENKISAPESASDITKTEN